MLIVFHHHRRRILHWAVSLQPTEDWLRQQLREAFPYDTAPRYLILDRDPRFGRRFLSFLRNLGVKPVRISPRSPWQYGLCERFVGSARREILDHVVIFNERHLHALLKDYIEVYYHLDRTHLGLDKETPRARLPEPRPAQGAKVMSFSRVGGLHHRYSWLEAA